MVSLFYSHYIVQSTFTKSYMLKQKTCLLLVMAALVYVSLVSPLMTWHSYNKGGSDRII